MTAMLFAWFVDKMISAPKTVVWMIYLVIFIQIYHKAGVIVINQYPEYVPEKFQFELFIVEGVERKYQKPDVPS